MLLQVCTWVTSFGLLALFEVGRQMTAPSITFQLLTRDNEQTKILSLFSRVSNC